MRMQQYSRQCTFARAASSSAKKPRRSTTAGSADDVARLYQRKTPIEHVLIRPDTYVGSVEQQTMSSWVVRPADGSVVRESVTFVPVRVHSDKSVVSYA